MVSYSHKAEDLAQDQGRPLTGRMVLLWLIGFFVIVFGANGVMMHFAIATFSGLEEANAYSAGLSYDQQIRDEKAQEALGWSVDLSLQRSKAGMSEFVVRQHDAKGAAISDLEIVLLLEHPADRRRDQKLVLTPLAAGSYHQSAAIEAGRWDVITQIKQNDHLMFRSRNRVVIEPSVKETSQP